MTPNNALPDDLLPCPFCGDAPLGITTHEFNNPFSLRYSVDCECGANGAQDVSEDRAIKAWNTRAPCRDSYNAGFKFATETAAIQPAASVGEEVREAIAYFNANYKWKPETQKHFDALIRSALQEKALGEAEIVALLCRERNKSNFKATCETDHIRFCVRALRNAGVIKGGD